MITLIAGSGPWKRRVIMVMERQNSGCGRVENPITREVMRTVYKWRIMAFGMMWSAKFTKSLSATVVRKTHHDIL